MIKDYRMLYYTMNMRHLIATFFVILLFAVPWLMTHPRAANSLFSVMQDVEDGVASVINAHNPKTVAQIRATYDAAVPQVQNPQVQSKKVRILLVAGHEPQTGGAEYTSLKERNMTVELADDLRDILAHNDHYEVFVSRDNNSWNPTLADYFKNNWDDIIAWQKAHHNEIKQLTRVGNFTSVPATVIHNKAAFDDAIRLYGVDKWVDENNIDIVIHIHFDDYPGHRSGAPGKYSGFSIYVPQAEYDNSTTTKALADSIFKRLGKYNAVSDLPGESTGIVEDQDLIAVGAYNSVDAASMLIEYGYIYEPQFTNDALRSKAIEDLAFQTYLGLQDFFDINNDVNLAGSFDTIVMPHDWETASKTTSSSSEIFALQTALVLDGDYPPADRNKNDCPRTGTLGPCTKSAISAFQKKYNIVGENGVGPKTIEELNRLYSQRRI